MNRSHEVIKMSNLQQAAAAPAMRDYPMDRIVQKNADRICVERFVAFGDPIFSEHFPERAVLPGSFLLGTAIAAAQQLVDSQSAYRVEIERVVYLRPVEPGDILLLEVWRAPCKDAAQDRSAFRFTGSARHDSRPFAEGLLVLVDGGQP